MTKPIRFKKYANRRLYNTSDSKYMTLEEIAALIRQGHQIEVIDAKTKRDVTAFILTQIVLEQAKNKNTLLPIPLLHLIIRFGDNVLVDFFENHLQQVIGHYLEYKQTMDTQFQRWLDLSRNLTETAQESMKSINPLQSYFGPRRKREKSDDEEK